MKRFGSILIFLIFIGIVFSATIHVRSEEVKGTEDYYVLSGNVIVEKEEIKVETQMATVALINDEWRKLQADGGINIKTDTMESTAISLDFDLKTEKGNLQGNVVTRIKIENEEGKVEYIIIRCYKITFDNKNKKYFGEMKEEGELIKIEKGDYKIETERFEYDENSKKLVLEGKVRIVNEVKKMDVKTDMAVFVTDKNEIEAKEAVVILEVED